MPDSMEIDPVRPELTRSGTSKSKTEGRSRAGTLLSNAEERFNTSRPAVGMFHAFGSAASNVPTLNDIETGNFNSQGWSAPGQRRNSQARRISLSEDARPPILSQPTLETITEPEKVATLDPDKEGGVEALPIVTESSSSIDPRDPTAPYPNGYQFPPKHTVSISLVAFSKWVITPFGFLLTLYALNIVAWGGMLFLILIRATPAMAHPSWNSWDSGAKTWLEIDSQILNALFCVTGIGLAPWRFRDLYWLLQWRARKREEGLRRLAGIHRDWFRLVGFDKIDPLFNPVTHEVPDDINISSLALPIALSPSPPLTGFRAPPSSYRLLDFVIWGFVWNTFLQIVLNGLMWGMNKYNRPSWSVGLFISLACIVASVAGWVIFKEGKRVKKVEGVPVSEADRKILERQEVGMGSVMVDWEGSGKGKGNGDVV